MIPVERKAWLRYSVAALASSAALILAITLQHPWVTLSPFFLFYGAVAISSWFGGTGPGLLSIAIGAVAADYYLLTPARSFVVDHPQDVARLVLFTSVGVLIAGLNGALHRATRRCALEAEAARRSEARSKRLAEANLIGVFFSDLDGDIRWANHEFLRLLGKDEQQLATQKVNWREMTAPEHRPRDERAIEELRACRVCTPFEKDHVIAGTQRIPVLVGCAVVSDVNDVVGFVLDLTERKKAEAEIRKNQERLRAMSSELMMAEERERRRIAVVLHDSVVQMLALAKLNVDAARRVSDGALSKKLNEAYDAIDQSITQARTLTAEISPPVLYELGLAAAIQWLGDRMRTEHGLKFELQGDVRRQPMPEEVRTVLYQAVRELLINVVKHARASQCVVKIERSREAISVVVADNGVGTRQNDLIDYTKGGFGLFNIRQRLTHLGGSLSVESAPGGGTTITVRAPLPQAVEQEST